MSEPNVCLVCDSERERLGDCEVCLSNEWTNENSQASDLIDQFLAGDENGELMSEVK